MRYLGNLTDDNSPQIQSQTALAFGSGRFTLSTNNSWVSSAHQSYGFVFHNKTENAGTGSDPTPEWENLDVILPAGRMVKRLILAIRVNNNDVTDLEISAGVKNLTGGADWITGVDDDSESEFVEAYRDYWVTPSVGDALGGNINDLHLRRIEIDHTAAEDSFLMFYLRPTGTLGAARYAFASWAWEIV